MTFSPNAAVVFADGPGDDPYHPDKALVRQLLTQYEDVMLAFLSNGGLVYQTKSAMDADLAHAANTMAWVIDDPTVANNGIYMKLGASGAGSWLRISDLPISFIVATDEGTGSPNVVEATSVHPISESALVLLNIFETNTGTPVTVQFNGGPVYTVKTNSGNDPAAGGLQGGMLVLGRVSGSTFRLVTDQISTAIIAQAEAVLEQVEDVRDVVLGAVPNVFSPTRTALKALNTATTTAAYLTEAGREGQFLWRTGDYTARIASDLREILYIKADAVSAGSGAWVRQGGWAVSGVNVEWAGTAHDGTTDDSVPIQAAINLGYGVNFGPYSYKATGLTVANENQAIRGVGRKTRILDASNTADLFIVGDGSNAIRGVSFKDFLVWGAAGVNKTAGHVINSRFGSRLIIENVYFGGLDDYVANANATPLWDGIYFDRFAECAIRGGQFCVKNKGLKARGNLDQSFGVELTIDDHVRFVFCGNYAIHIGGACGGVYFDRVDVSNCLRGVQIDKALQNAPNREIFISKAATFDTCSEWGMVIGDDGAALVQSDGWFCSCGTATAGGNAGGGVLVLPTTAGNVRVDMTGATIYNNRGDGIRALAGIWTITGCKINLNGQGANGGCGFIAEAAPVVAVICGNSITNNGNGTRGVGVQFAHASNNNHVVSSNDLRGNGIAGFSTSASPPYSSTRIVVNNIGFTAS